MDPFAIETNHSQDHLLKPQVVAPALSFLVWGGGQLYNGEWKKASIFFTGQLVSTLYLWDFFSHHVFYRVMTAQIGAVIYNFLIFLFSLGALFVWIYNLYDAHRIAQFLEFIQDRNPEEQIEEIGGWDFEKDYKEYARRFPWGSLFVYSLAVLIILKYVLSFRTAQSEYTLLVQQSQEKPADLNVRMALVDYYESKGKYRHAELELDEFLRAYSSGLSVEERQGFEKRLEEVRGRVREGRVFVTDTVLGPDDNVDWEELYQTLNWNAFEKRAWNYFRVNRENKVVFNLLLGRYLSDSAWAKVKDLVNLALQQNPQDPSLIKTLATAESKLLKQKQELGRLEQQKVSLMQAVASFKSENLSSALESVKAYFAQGGQSKEAYLLQNAILLKTKDYVAAVAALNEAIIKYPQEAVFHYSLGKVFFAENDFAKAVTLFEKAVELRPGDAEMHKNLAVSYKKLEKFDEAIKWCLSALEIKPDDPKLLFLLAHTQMQADESKKAVEIYRKLALLDSDYPELYYYMAQAEEKGGLLIGARSSFRKVTSESPFYEQAQLKIEELGVKIARIQDRRVNTKKSQSGPLDQAPKVKSLTNAIETPSKPKVNSQATRVDQIADLLKQAEMAYYAENWNDALNNYEELLKIDSRHFHSLKQMGRIYLERKADYQAAELALKRALALKPDDTWLNSAMGIVSKSRYDLNQAKAYFDKALSTDPNDLNANFNMALFYEDQNDLDRAKQYYNNVIANHPNHLLAYNYLGDIYYNEGNFNLAIQLYTALLKISPENVGIRFKLALGLEQAGQNKLSLDELVRLSQAVRGEEFMEQEIAEAKARVQAKL